MSFGIFSGIQKVNFKHVWNLTFVLSVTVIVLKIISDSKYKLLAEGDTGLLIHGTREIVKCINEWKWGNCAAGGPLPLLQYIPVYLTQILGLTQPMIMRVLGVMSTMAFFGSLLIYFNFFYKSNRRHLAWLASFVFISSPFLVYSRSTFGEMLTAFLTLAGLWLVLKKAGILKIAAITILISITKDFAAIFFSLLGCAAALSYWKANQKEAVKSIAGMTIGSAVGLAIVITLNFFRAGHPYNALYMLKHNIVPDIETKLSFFAGQWLAFNSGMLFCWFSFCFIMAAIVMQKLSFKMKDLIRSCPLWIICSVLIAITAGLSSWWAPFGWIAWGPRLMIPWIPAVTLLVLHLYHKDLFRALSMVARHRFLVVTIAGFTIFSALGQFYGAEDPHKFSTMIVEPNPPSCPVPSIIERDQSYYYRCVGDMIWKPKHFILPYVIAYEWTWYKFWTGLCFILCLFGMLLKGTEPLFLYLKLKRENNHGEMLELHSPDLKS